MAHEFAVAAFLCRQCMTVIDIVIGLVFDARVVVPALPPINQFNDPYLF